MTIEKLARMSQKEFTSTREEMRESFTAVRKELKGETGLLRRDLEAGFMGLSDGMKAIMEKLNSIQLYSGRRD